MTDFYTYAAKVLNINALDTNTIISTSTTDITSGTNWWRNRATGWDANSKLSLSDGYVFMPIVMKYSILKTMFNSGKLVSLNIETDLYRYSHGIKIRLSNGAEFTKTISEHEYMLEQYLSEDDLLKISFMSL